MRLTKSKCRPCVKKQILPGTLTAWTAKLWPQPLQRQLAVSKQWPLATSEHLQSKDTQNANYAYRVTLPGLEQIKGEPWCHTKERGRQSERGDVQGRARSRVNPAQQ
jgi:hypothetical protein